MYRLKNMRFYALALAIGLFGMPHLSVAQDADRKWVSKIVSVQGRVVAKRQGQSGWQTVQLDDNMFAGDRIRVEANSRAGIVLSNDAILRLDQNTTLVFSEIKKETTFIFKLLKGAAHFFSRKSRSLRFLTPFVNGVVEGTEFYVKVDSEQTRIDLFEGRVLAENSYGELRLTKGQGALASDGSGPQRKILVRPRDSVQWALYYPPVWSLRPDESSTDLLQSYELFTQGRPLEAFDRLSQVAETDRDTTFYAYRAGLRLQLGRVSQARDDLQQALVNDPDNGEALALQAVIAVVQNRKEEALEMAQKAVRSQPNSTAAQIALSYAQQAGFNLTGALEAAQAAVDLSPENGVAWARLAELRLSTHRLDKGIQAARKAAELNPNLAHAQTVLGFAFLTRIKTQMARDAFLRAILLDSTAPLPRLGLGLANIRDGHLKKGRAEIEIAAGLDPANALMRSYLGKAYFEEKRGDPEGRQLEIAKTLDPSDPTPWYYDAIRKQTLNLSVEALRDLLKSKELNDNRAVFRSRLLLDEDLAARSASLGRIYSDLGFEQLALSEGWKAVSTGPSDYSGHRLLADSYSKLRRHDIARASELLQSKLLQPLNATPIQPQLGETNLLIPEGLGPSRVSFNEFNPLFMRDGIRLQASGLAGNNDTLGDELTLSGIYRRFSFSLGQLHYENDGFRDNNDLTQDIYNGFAQVSLSQKTSVQLELRSRENERGDLRMLFEPDNFAPNVRNEEKEKSIRIGGRHRFSPKDTLIISLIHSEKDNRKTDRAEVVDPFQQITVDTDIKDDSESDSGETQYQRQSDRYSAIIGLGFLNQDRTDDAKIVSRTVIPPFSPIINNDGSIVDNDTRYSNYYLYTHLKFIKDLTWSMGLSYDSFKSQVVEEDKFSPKAGLIWSPHRALTFRAAWFQNIKRPFNLQETLEPTNIGGFNQFFDDIDGSEIERYGVAADAQISSNLFGGVELSWRDVNSPHFSQTSGITTFEDQRERLHRAYLNWMPTKQLAISLEGFLEDIENPDAAPNEVTTYRYPVGFNYQFPFGLSAKVVSTFVDQTLKNKGEASKSDDFWIVDTTLVYRLPKRLGAITLGVKNLFDEEFNFQDMNFNTNDPLAALYIPARLVFGQVTLSF